MDTTYAAYDLPFGQALAVVATVIHANERYAVADCGLKALAMDHGNSAVADATVWFHSDEHVTFAPSTPVRVGDRIFVRPAHVDPTVAYHARMHVAEGAHADAPVVDTWAVDMRGWDTGASFA
jgi:D-serine deaminase-like pyridoxal phosphate-dependent protein